CFPPISDTPFFLTFFTFNPLDIHPHPPPLPPLPKETETHDFRAYLTVGIVIQKCAKCGHPVNGPYCQGCTLLREKLEEDLVTYFQNFQNTSESSDDSTNVVNAPRDPFVVKQDHGVNPPHIDECCYECENIEYVEASPHDFKLVSLEATEIVILKVEKIEDDNLREKLLNVRLLIANIEALKDDPTPSSKFLTKSSFTSPKSFLEETNTFHNSLPEFENFCFDLEEISSGICENLSSITCVNLPIEDDHSPLLAYVVWIFLAYLTYPVIPPYLHSFGNEDTIFDPGITMNRVYSFKPGLSHRCGAFKKFSTHCSHLNEWPMIINGKNTPILDVLMFHFYAP
nr:hypothetical protein [Tanacetum cinerariifolium]